MLKDGPKKAKNNALKMFGIVSKMKKMINLHNNNKFYNTYTSSEIL